MVTFDNKSCNSSIVAIMLMSFRTPLSFTFKDT